MSEWQNKSDFDINKAVAISLGIKTQHKTGISKYKGSPDGYMVVTREPLQRYPFDPVNNPQHAWPIIETFKCAFSSNGAYEPKTDRPWCCDENRLRAAMIVYLEMNEVKP